MPELPEVETIARDVDELARGRTIMEALVAETKIVASPLEYFAPLLAGAKILEVRRLGKWIHFRLKKGRAPESALLTHLKMTGQFRRGAWPEKGAVWPPHARAAFRLSGLPAGAETLFYCDVRKFGRLRAFERPELLAFLEELAQGPDPLTVEPEEFHRRLTARSGRLKGVLLDQHVVAGLGNIYVDEGLFAAGLSPVKPAKSLTGAESARLLQELKRILAAAIRARGSTTDNYQGLKGGGHFQASHQVYGRAGQPCPKCLTSLLKGVVAGRGTTWCPRCQAAAAAAASK